MPKAPWEYGSGGKPAPKKAMPRPAGGGNAQRVAAAEAARQERMKPNRTKEQVVRLAARLWKAGQDPTVPQSARDRIAKTLKVSLQGYQYGENADKQFDLEGKKGVEWSQKYGVPQKDLIQMFAQVKPPYKHPSLDPTNALSEAVKGAIVEGAPKGDLGALELWNWDPGKALKGAEKGFTGQKRYEGTQAASRLTGTSKKEAREDAESLPGPVRFIANTAVDVATNPSTYVSFGTTATEQAAARSAAAVIAETVGKEAAPAILARLSRRGLRGLSKVERQAIEEKAPKLVKHLRGASGGVKVAGRTVKGTDALVEKLQPFRQKLAQKALGAEGGAGEYLTKAEQAASPRAGLRQLERAGEAPVGTAAAVDAARARFMSWRTHAEQLQRRLVKVSAKLTDDEKATIAAAVDVGGGRAAIEALPKKLRGAAQVLDDVRAHAITNPEREVGLLGGLDAAAPLAGRIKAGEMGPPSPLVPDEQYLPRYTTPEGRAEVGRATERLAPAGRGQVNPLGGPYSGPMSGNRLARGEEWKFRPAAARTTKEGAPFYEPDPFKAMGKRGAESARDVARVKYVNEMANVKLADGSSLLRPVEEGLDPAKWTRVKVPIQGSTRTVEMAVRKEAAADFERVVKVMTDDNALNHVMKGFDSYMALWKAYATVPLPFGLGFMLRNAEGNFFNGYYLTNTNPVWSVRAMGVQRKMWKGNRHFGDPFHYLSGKQRDEVKEAFDTGVLESGFFENDIEGAAQDLTGVKKADRANPLKTGFAPLEYGRRLNSAIEQNARLGLYLAQRNKGMLPDDAASIVRKYLFDYSDLTELDKKAKKISPFWTFMRKNTPLQVEHFLKTPGKYSNLKIVLNNLDAGGRSNDMPSWMQDEGAVALPDWANPNSDQSAWIPDLPPQAALDALQPVLPKNILAMIRRDPEAFKDEARAIVNSLGIGGPAGMVKSLVELAAGGQAFSGRPFVPGEQVETPSYLNWIPGAPKQIPYELQFLGEQALPAFTKVRGAAPSDPSDADKRGARLASMFTGQSIRPLGAATRRSAYYEDLRLEDALRRLLADQGVAVGQLPRRSSKASKTTEGSRASGPRKAPWEH